MFKAKIEDLNMNSQPVKASAAKGIRQQVLDTYPNIAEYLDEIWPKKAKVFTLKFKGEIIDSELHLNFIKVEEEILFLEMRDKAILPMLRLLHKYPIMMNQMQCDKGAIRHIFSGSNVMAPGLISEGGKCVDGLEVGAPVAVMAEGKQHAMAIGYLTMSSKDIKSVGKGFAIEVIQFLNDALWKDVK